MSPSATPPERRPAAGGAGLRRRRRQPRRRDRRGATAGAVLRRLDDRLGEHDRRRPRRPLGRLLARRPLRRSPPAHARPLPARPRRGAADRRGARSPPAPSSASRSTPSTPSRSAASPARSSACWSWSRCRSPCSAPRRPGRCGSRVADAEQLRRGGRAALRDLDRRLAVRHDAGGAAADPAARHPAHLPRLRRRAGPGRRGWARLALRRRPAALALAVSLPVGTIKAADTGRVLYEAETTHEYARVVERPDGSRVLELNEGQAVHSLYRPGQLPDRRLLGRPPRSCPSPARRAAAAADRDPRQRRRHGRPRLRSLLPPHRGRRGRDRRRADRAGPPLLRPAQPAHAGSSPRTPGPGCGARRAATTRSWSTPTASPTSPSTWRRASSSSWPASASPRAASSIVNVGHPEGSEELERVLGRTMAAAFPSVLRYPIEPTNTLLVAGEGPLSAARLRAQRRRAARRDCARWRAKRPPSSRPASPGGEVYTDDHAPVEWLVDSSLLEYANGE